MSAEMALLWSEAPDTYVGSLRMETDSRLASHYIHYKVVRM